MAGPRHALTLRSKGQILVLTLPWSRVTIRKRLTFWRGPACQYNYTFL